MFISYLLNIQYIPRNMHTVFALLCFVVVIDWLIFPYPSGLLHWHCGNLTIAPVPAKQPWWVWINTSCEFIINDYKTTTKQSTTKPCAYFLEYTVPYGDCPVWTASRMFCITFITIEAAPRWIFVSAITRHWTNIKYISWCRTLSNLICFGLFTV